MWLFEKPIAHRGLHIDGATENSMESFRKAIDKGYHIETDVHLLKSGEVVVFHDSTLKRVCNKNVKIEELTLDDIKSDNYLLPNGEHIPLFSEMLDLVNGKTGILLELKFAGFGTHKLEEEVYKLIKGKESWIAVQSFSPFIVTWFAENAPEFYRGLLSMAILGIDVPLHYKKMKPHFISYQIGGIGCVKRFVEKKGLNLLTWTINTEAKVNAAIKNKVNNIIFENVDLDAIDFSLDKLAPPKL